MLDEPSIGLHQRDSDHLIEALRDMRDLGNSVIVWSSMTRIRFALRIISSISGQARDCVAEKSWRRVILRKFEESQKSLTAQ